MYIYMYIYIYTAACIFYIQKHKYIRKNKAKFNVEQIYQIFLLTYSVGFFHIQLLENQFILLNQIGL